MASYLMAHSTRPGRALSRCDAVALEVDGPPAVPGRDRAVGAERVAQRLELLGRGRGVDTPGEGVPHADAEVVNRPDVEAAQLEEQEHLRGPAADAAHLDEAGDDLVVAEPARPGEHDRSVHHLCREVADGCSLGRR